MIKKLYSLICFLLFCQDNVNAEMYGKNPMIQGHPDSLSRIAPILGESAIVDKKTGRVFWQGGKQSLFDSVVGHSYLNNQEEGVLKHVRATLLSCIIWMSFIRFIAEWALKQKILSKLAENLTNPSQKALDFLRLLTRATLFCLACLPKFSREFLAAIIIMYLLESYTCSTRKYLDNSLSCSNEVEHFMEGLREREPSVSWQIRCYHYEKRKWLSLFLLADGWKYFQDTFLKQNDEPEEKPCASDESLGPSVFTRKVISHQMKETYKVGSWVDETIGGIWKKAPAATTVMAAFTKVSFHKVLLFANEQARVDYFKQQSDFISREGRKDEYAEFSTHVDVQGYKERVLAVRPTVGVQKLFTVQYFWLFTMLGLTVPYRIKFSKHCDEFRVAVVKEISAKIKKPEKESSSVTKQSSWFTPRSWFSGNVPGQAQAIAEDSRREKFKKQMQEISLYHEKQAAASETSKSDGIQSEDGNMETGNHSDCDEGHNDHGENIDSALVKKNADVSTSGVKSNDVVDGKETICKTLDKT